MQVGYLFASCERDWAQPRCSFSVSVPRRIVSVRPGAVLPGRGTTNRTSASPRRLHTTAARSPRLGDPTLLRGVSVHTQWPKRLVGDLPASCYSVGVTSLGYSRAVEQLY